MRKSQRTEGPLVIQPLLFKDLNSPAQDPLPVMGVANLATERVMLAVLLAPMMFGQEPLLLIKRQRKEAQIPLKGEGLKEVKEKGNPLSAMQGNTIRRKGSVSTSPEAMDIASSGTRAASSTKDKSTARSSQEAPASSSGCMPASLIHWSK